MVYEELKHKPWGKKQEELENLLADERWNDDPFYDLLVQAHVCIPKITIIKSLTPDERIKFFEERDAFERRLEVCVQAYIRRYGGINSVHIKLAAAHKYMGDNPGERMDSPIRFGIFQEYLERFERETIVSAQTPKIRKIPVLNIAESEKSRAERGKDGMLELTVWKTSMYFTDRERATDYVNSYFGYSIPKNHWFHVLPTEKIALEPSDTQALARASQFLVTYDSKGHRIRRRKMNEEQAKIDDSKISYAEARRTLESQNIQADYVNAILDNYYFIIDPRPKNARTEPRYEPEKLKIATNAYLITRQGVITHYD